MKYSLLEQSQAVAQLNEQAQYIHDQGQPTAARRLLERNLDICDDLTRWPEIGHPFETTTPKLAASASRTSRATRC